MWQNLWNWHLGQPFAALDDPAGPEAEALAQLRGEDFEGRMAAAEALGGSSASDKALEALRGALRDEAEPVRLNAAYALAASGAPAIDALIDCLDDDLEPARKDAAYGLSAVGLEAESALIAACADAAESRRGYAAFALGEMGAHVGLEAAAAVAGLAADASEFVRRNAADALATMTAHADHAVPALTTLLGDESSQVCFDAAYGLAHHGAAVEPALEALVAALEHENRYVRNHSVEALKRINTPAATAALLDFLETSRWCPMTSKESTF
jgi:HEAT repeat protein